MKYIAICCFTGHLPEKLNVSREIAINLLKKMVEDAFDDGVTAYITGISRGIDIWGAEEVLELKKISLYKTDLCSAFESFENTWEMEWQNKYRRILLLADEVHYICDGFSRRVYQLRNEWMIDHASMVIAGYTGAAGRTRNTLEYANKKTDYIIRIIDFNKEI